MSDLHPITCPSLLEEADRAFRGDFSPLLDDVRMEIREHLDLMDKIE